MSDVKLILYREILECFTATNDETSRLSAALLQVIRIGAVRWDRHQRRMFWLSRASEIVELKSVVIVFWIVRETVIVIDFISGIEFNYRIVKRCGMNISKPLRKYLAMRVRVRLLMAWTLMLCLLPSLVCQADDLFQKKEKYQADFDRVMAPLIAGRCLECHAGLDAKAGFDFSSRATTTRGGESGPALQAGNPEASLIWEYIDSNEMPPEHPLSTEEKKLFKQWIKAGAPWGTDPIDLFSKTTKKRAGYDWWSLQPLRQVTVPPNHDTQWSRNSIDAFILARLRAYDLTPQPRADRRTLIRRLYYSLIGLPPEPEDVEAFVADTSSDAYEKLVDQLLASHHYGEHWARHWLDVVRFGESNGFERDQPRLNAWHYRNWVIRAFNQDLPYDEFVRLQLAGDLLEPSNPQAVTATGFLVAGPHDIVIPQSKTMRETMRQDELEDTIGVVGQTFLGLTVNCARCHDHKFDPIPHQDYYRLRAFFAPLMPRDDVPFVTPKELAEYNQKLELWEKKTKEIRASIDELTQETLEKAAQSQIKMFPADLQEIMAKPELKRTALEHQLADLVQRQVDIKQKSSLASLKKSEKPNGKKYNELLKALAAFDKLKPEPLPTGMSVTDSQGAAPVTTIPDDPDHKPIVPGFLSLLKPGEAEIVPISTAPHSSGRRTALANWLVNPQNRLTTRVMTNRVWQYHFGTGLVSTSNDFGHMGESPSHPELMDWLTTYFVENGWSIKKLHRLIMNSSTYRLSAFHPDSRQAELKDPQNALHWRANIRRLNAEDIRDSALFLSGEIDLKQGGPCVKASQTRRSVYTIMKRNVQDPVLGAFDLPGGIKSRAQRDVTTTATQALLMLNGDWFLKRANAMARSLKSKSFDNDQELVTYLHKMTYGKTPEPAEVEMLTGFLKTQEQSIKAKAENQTKSFVGQITQTTGEAVKLGKGSTLSSLHVPASKTLPDQDFTIEAYVQLESIYENAAVNTIASQWTGNTKTRGWSLGVTSLKSAYKPRNLILQLVGNNKAGKLTYEVVASNLHLELNKPYYVAATVKISEAGTPGIQFYVKELFSEKPLKSVSVKHKVISDYRPDNQFVLGGRDKTSGSKWNGLLDQVRLSGSALSSEELLINSSEKKPASTIGWWQFNTKSGLLKNSIADALHLLPPSEASMGTNNARQQALADLCHVMLNSSQFLYLD